jgi:hypothetical protein
MKAFTYPPDLFSQFSKYRWGITIDLSGWAVPFMIGAAMLFLALYLHLLSDTSLLRRMRAAAIVTVLCASFLSFAAAESMATYLFSNTLSAPFNIGVNHWMNAPWIILHAVLLVILYVKRKRRV